MLKMMEVNQPIGTVAIEMQKMNSTSSVTNDNDAMGLPDTLLDTAVTQNGTNDKTVCSEVSMEIDNSKDLHDEDSMENLAYSETDNVEDEDSITAAEATNNDNEMAEPISGTLVNDIQLNKTAIGLEEAAIPDRLAKENFHDVSTSLELSASASIGEDDTLTEVLAAERTEISEELDENLLLDGEDDTEVEDVDENLLLEDTEIGKIQKQNNEKNDTMQNSVIQIEDSVVSAEKTEDETAFNVDSSIMVIDESGLSILNTATVDMADVTVDESIRIVEEREQLETAVEPPEQPQSTEPNQPPICITPEENVTSMSDNLGTVGKDEYPIAPTSKDEHVSSCPASPKLSDLIKLPDVDKTAENSVHTENTAIVTESKEKVVQEVGITEKAPTENNTQLTADANLPEELSVPITVPDEESNQDDIDPELSDLIKFPDESTPKEDTQKIEESAQSNDTIMPVVQHTEKDDTSEEKFPGESVAENDKSEKTEATDKSAADDQQTVETSRQALQAADEEDLLEMMEEPERMEADDDDEDNGDEDLDEHSSESGSAKQTQVEDEEDFEESDYVGLLEEDDISRNAEENETVDGEISGVQIDGEEFAVKPPPSKRRCSIDVRDSAEAENASKKEDFDKVSEEGERTDKKVENVGDALEKESHAERVDKEIEATVCASASVEKLSDEVNIADLKEMETEETSAVETCAEGTKTDQDTNESQSISDAVHNDIEQERHKEEALKESTDAKEEKIIIDKQSSSEKDTVSSSEEVAATESKPVEAEGETVDVSDQAAKVDEMEATNEGKSICKDKESEVALGAEDKHKPFANDQDEVLVIDDDDDVPEKLQDSAKREKESVPESEINEKKDVSVTVTGKRPCPEDTTEEKDEKLEPVKKMRLSEEDSKIKKMEDVTDVPKEEKKSILDSIEPITIVLDPNPSDPPKEKKPLKLEFMDKFKKPLEKMERTDLEEFVLQKIVEGIAFKSAIAEMRTQLDSQDVLLQGYRQKVHDLNKQFKDLEMVHERVVKDLEKKNQHFITPVKITRAVGLQVSQPRFVPGNRPSVGNTTPSTNSPKASTSRSSVEAPVPASSPNRNNSQTNVTNRRSQLTRVPSVVINTKTPAGQSTNRPNQQSTNNNKSSPISSSAGTPTAANKSASAVQTNSVNNSSPQQQQSSTIVSGTTTPSGAVPPLTRKRPLQKFTPMRPPLSITQQVQQQQQTRQMQEHLVRQQIQEVQTGASGSTASGSQPQSPVSHSPQGSPLTRTPEPSPLGISPARVPPIVMKKVGQQTKGIPATMQIINRQTPSMVSTVSSGNVRTISASSTTVPAPPVPTIDNSLIDLTDEDDSPKPAAASVTVTSAIANVVPKPPITILNGQQQQYVQRQGAALPPLVVINQQRVINRTTLQQRPLASGTVGAVTSRPMLIQRPGSATNGFPRAVATQQMYKPRMPNGQADVPRRIVSRATIRQQTTVSTTTFTHPAPLPQPGAQMNNPTWKQAPPRPSIRINNIETGIVISWTMDDLSEGHATIVSYQIYAYQETSAPPSMDMWRHVGDVKAMLLPMAVTLTQFQEGQRYHFAVRAVDEHQRVGQFSPPRTWNESTPAKT